MKIGLDVHGVIDKAPEFFGVITNLLKDNGHEVHIITGVTREDYARYGLSDGVVCTHFYSITDDLKNQGKPWKDDIHGRPLFNEYDWNTAKATYCKDNKIDIMLDDTVRYGKHFSTPFFLFQRV